MRIVDSLVSLVQQSPTLQARFIVVRDIAHNLGLDLKCEWVESLATEALSLYTAFDLSDVPFLIEIVKEKGVGVIEARCAPLCRIICPSY